MGILNAIAALITGLQVGNRAVSEAAKRADDWFKFGMSLFGTVFVTFIGVWGLTTSGLLYPNGGVNVSIAAAVVALIAGFAAGLVSTSAVTLYLWKRSPLTRGIPIAAPMKIEEKVLQGGMVLTEPAENPKGGK